MEIGWLNKMMDRLGFSLTGWLANLLKTVILIIVIITIICIALSCIKKLII